MPPRLLQSFISSRVHISQWMYHSSRFNLCHRCHRSQLLHPNARITTPTRLFHTVPPRQIPIIPIPAIILSVLKTGKLISFVSLSSKTSLTLLPHTLLRNRGRRFAKLLAGIPLIGFTLLVVVGLDQAPNTARLRLIYLSEEEEKEIAQRETDELLQASSGLVADRDNAYVQWLQTIVDNLALVAVDDVRDAVRKYGDDEDAAALRRKFEVNIICDSSTLNAMCAGNQILVYDLMIHYMDYDTTRMAVILSHEIAHSLQRHFVETHGFASLMLMLGDITRGVFWIVTESLGPYVNQKINDAISTFVTMETQTTYNRRLEKEADLVGLKLLAKAGYDPTVAIDVWSRMAKIDELSVTANKDEGDGDISAESKAKDINEFGGNLNLNELLENLLNSWFGSTHPPSQERVDYMREHMDEALEIYRETLRLNGPPAGFDNNPYEKETSALSSETANNTTIHVILSYVKSCWTWLSPSEKSVQV
ncbi:peptidase family M48-domain-containing protein [Radiomyces spectabilis]|uniref:peptidase family M48-domain-containing protein n=1 Tax=Radiomyces spectabilis TaxID=64574 RepID=UPI0022202B17|nr:peptidase family M48-domain-containing protein [Radiomyces spectabilis]KAI8365174.1 peptidase family M48-domain-containing protein [Radiomyces spectabilis]